MAAKKEKRRVGQHVLDCGLIKQNAFSLKTLDPLPHIFHVCFFVLITYSIN